MVSGAYIYMAPEFDPITHRSVHETSLFKMQLIGIDPGRLDELSQVSRLLLQDGVQFIELCGGFGPSWISKIKEATGHKIPIGGVFYGPEDRKSLLALSL